MSVHQFQAEVNNLLGIVTKSLYSERGIFLRELISNASDACDRLRYDALINPELLSGDSNLRIAVVVDRERSVISVVDNGIGMERDELLENLGTIARSGTALVRQQFEADSAGNASSRPEIAADDSDGKLELIGQFGIGFYAAFAVAKQVEVFTRRAGADQGWRWVSDGNQMFTITPAGELTRGTTVELTLRDDAHEFLDEDKINQLVRKYCDHITLPITLGLGENSKVINNAVALWSRPKHKVTKEQYTEFYRHISQSFSEPWLTIHWRAEGHFEYSCLLFIPNTRPWDLADPQRKQQIKLYVRRIFIADDLKDFIPGYLRFLCGVVDSADLPLNVSRELLQNNQMLAKIKSGLIRRVLHELTLIARASGTAQSRDESQSSNSVADKPSAAPASNDNSSSPNSSSPDYLEFWEKYGPILKEGLYEDETHRHELLELVRFRSTTSDGWISLQNYTEHMLAGQEAIYYLSGEHLPSLVASPQLEGFRARGITVLLMSDAVDEFWIPAVGFYREKPLRSVTRGLADLSGFQLTPQASDSHPQERAQQSSNSESISGLVARLQRILSDHVREVRTSDRLVGSAVCLVAGEDDAMDLRMERLMRQHHQLHMPNAKRILEINPTHPLIQKMAAMIERLDSDTLIDDIGWLLLEQARILERETIVDPSGFTRRLSNVMLRGLEVSD